MSAQSYERETHWTIPKLYSLDIGHVYLFQWKHYYKIGRTYGSVKSRLSQLECMPEPLGIKEIWSVKVDFMAIAEEFLHAYFAHKRFRREWFTLSPSDVLFICSLNPVILEQMIYGVQVRI